MKGQESEQRSSTALWVVIGLAVLATAVLLFMRLFLTADPAPTPPPRTSTAASPTPTPTPEPSPSASSVVSGEAQPATSPLPESPLLTPDPGPEIPTVAPHFVLERAGGGTFTLARELEEGPVVLVFFERCG